MRVPRLIVEVAAAVLCCLLLFCNAVVAQKMTVGKVRIAAENAFATGDMKKAVALYSKLIELEPKNERNYYKRFRAYLSERKYEHALSDLSASLTVKPTYKQALLQRGKLHMMLGECAEAAEDFNQYVKLNPKDTSGVDNLGKSSKCAGIIDDAGRAQAHGDYAAAYNLLSQVLDEMAVSSIPLLLQRAQLSVMLNQPYDAIADLGTVLKLDSANIPALLMRGEVFYSIGDKRSLDAAISHYRTGLHSDPEHRGLKKLYRHLKKLLHFINNAEAATERGDAALAVENWKSALEVDPTQSAVTKNLWLHLCESHMTLKQYANAQAACEHVVEIDDGNANAHVKLSEAHMGQDHFEDAVRHARRAAELDNQNQEYRDALHRAEVALKQSKEKNYYKILGIPRDASQKEIKKAYRKSALEWHPDKHADKSDAEREEVNKRFHDVVEAYEILSDDELRARYNRGEDISSAGQQQNPFNNNPFGQMFHQGQGFQFHFGGGGW